MTKKTVREIPVYDSKAEMVRGRMRIVSTTPRTDHDKQLVEQYSEEDGKPYEGPRYLARHEAGGRKERRAQRAAFAREIRREASKKLGHKPRWVEAKLEAHKRIVEEKIRQRNAQLAEMEASDGKPSDNDTSGK